MITDGLKQAAGKSLRSILANWTNTPLKGIASGFFMTAIVQSSSAVTVAAIGFVNAGLISMRQALGIVYGSNIGTAMTAWLVALLGFNLNIPAFALPLVGIGMLIKLIKQEGQAAAFGMALVGFGLFFIGIDVLKTAFEGVIQTFDLTQFNAEGISGVLIYLLLGITLTVLTQSSSASIALTITAGTSGMVGLNAAAAMIIGANVGTTSTAALASIAATSHAKRVALAQVIFNVGTGLVALLILPLMFLVIEGLSRFLGLAALPSVTLALFHTVFNVIGVMMIYPLNNRLANFLERCFISRQQKQSLPKYLDKAIAKTPILAVNAITLELIDVSQRVRQMVTEGLSSRPQTEQDFHAETNNIKRLLAEVSRFIVSLDRHALSEETIKQLATLLRIDQYLLSCTGLSSHLLEYRQLLNLIRDNRIYGDVETFYRTVDLYLQQDFIKSEAAKKHSKTQFSHIHKLHNETKAQLLLAGAQSQLSIEQMLEVIDALENLQKISEQWHKATNNLRRLYTESGTTQQHLGKEAQLQDSKDSDTPPPQNQPLSPHVENL
ncbi:Na/Pi cotransporter family protein [Aestuariicella hydrocarbonica]|uniref:Na/Pi cotransporter family protein n=2 Tax=Pseudomaricurvus hydrocarbonicus TaxID=1470433 RepID=A0A9E5MP14_9GAMM|nr:Na/Pi cotransporter family protein [Aestuariicella hydrocarbonica]